MPYVGNDVYFYAILPRERYGLDALLAKLDGRALLEAVGRRGKSEVNVSVLWEVNI